MTGGFGGAGSAAGGETPRPSSRSRGAWPARVDLQAIVPLILDTLFNIFPAGRPGLHPAPKDAETGQMVPVAQKHRRKDADETVKLSRTILNKVLKDKTGILGRRFQRFAV